jgi:hypothetical protein
VCFVSGTAQVELKSGRLQAPAVESASGLHTWQFVGRAVAAQVVTESNIEAKLKANYDKVPEAKCFWAHAQKIKLKLLESQEATSIIRRDPASFDSRVLS